MPRRRTEIFSMSFLDAICCGFGALVLLFMLITAQGRRHVEDVTQDLRAQALLVEQQLLLARQDAVEARNSAELLDQAKVRTEGLSARIASELESRREELAEAENDTLARRERLERLKADIAALEEGAKRLEAQQRRPQPVGASVRARAGQGDRMYLTGLRVGGQRILVLLDTSSSMLDETLVNILRLRNMADERKQRAEKWRQAVATLEWLVTQLPPGAQVQIYAFDVQPRPLLEGTGGQWLTVDGPTMERAVRAVRAVVPQGGTSLENAFALARQKSPQPDNLIVITDGLPTQGATPPRGRVVDGDDRLRFFERAVNVLPRRMPVSVILLPMEGDPDAPDAYWRLARATGGSFLSPAKDWP